MTVSATKNDLVLLLVKKATENPNVNGHGVMGKKALQKSMYFFNETFDLFTFKWEDYGPFSAEIQQIVHDFISIKKIKVTDIPTKKTRIYTKKMTFNDDKDNPYFQEINISNQIDTKMNDIVKFTSGKKPRELELLASVHYWAKRQFKTSKQYTSQFIDKKLVELKPEAGFTMQNVEDAIPILESSGYLTNLESD